MLPLVEAGATVEQAARRFGDEDSVPEIAAGFSRWRDREGRGRAAATPPPAPAGGPGLAELDRAVRDAQARITALEAENRELRRELTRARQAITRVRSILDSAAS
jgi:transposase-like protein